MPRSKQTLIARRINLITQIVVEAAKRIPGVFDARDVSPPNSTCRYVYVDYKRKNNVGVATIRISDHDDGRGGCDLYLWHTTPLHIVVEKLAQLFKFEPPPGFLWDILKKRAKRRLNVGKSSRKARTIRTFNKMLRSIFGLS